MKALVLSGGSLDGAAAIGAIQALEEMGRLPDVIIGNSSGAIIGGLYSMGVPISAIKSLAESLRRKDFPIDWRKIGKDVWSKRLWPDSIVNPAPLWDKLAPWFSHASFDNLKIPLWVVATSLTHRKVVLFGPSNPSLNEKMMDVRGFMLPSHPIELFGAIQASCAVPGFFPPVVQDDMILVDGGIGDDYPLDVAEVIGATSAIGVWIDAPYQWRAPRPRPHLINILVESMVVMIREISTIRRQSVKVPYAEIHIELTSGENDFAEIPRVIEMGYQRTMELREELRSLP